MSKNKETSWGHVSDWYDNVVEDTDSYHNKVISPNLIRLMEISPGEKVVDLACGQGFFTREIRKAGAHVIGVDIAKNLISKAESKSGDITYAVAPSHHFPVIKTATQSKVSIVLAIQNIEKLSETISEVARVLKPGGMFYIVLNHPTFRIPGISHWGFDEEANIQYRRLDGYLTEATVPIQMKPGSDPSLLTQSFHRPLQIYFKALRKNGFAVTRLEEWISHKESQKGPRQIAENKARKEFPLFMALEAKKI